jgi:hypothetical protein
MSSSSVSKTVGGKLLRVKVNGGFTQLAPGRLLQSLRAVEASFKLPAAMCWRPDAPSPSSERCRACVVEVDGKTVLACEVEVAEGISIVAPSAASSPARDAAEPKSAKPSSASSLPSVMDDIKLTAEDRAYFLAEKKCAVSRKINGMVPDDIIATLIKSGLPSYAQWQAARSLGSHGDQTRLLINAAEEDTKVLSHPNARMRTIVGAVAAAKIVGAKSIVVALRDSQQQLASDIEASFKVYVSKLNPDAAKLNLSLRVSVGQKEQDSVTRLTSDVQALALVPSIVYYGVATTA